MNKYEVRAPYVVFSIRDGNGAKTEYALRKGEAVELPEDAVAVRAMLAKKQIVVLPAKTTKK